MQTTDQTFSDYVATLKRRWRPSVIVGGALLLVFIAIAFSLPSIYESSATILIEQKKIPDQMIQSTVASYAEELLESVQQRVMAADNIVALIKKHKLYDEKSRLQDINALVDEFRLATVLVPAIAPQVQERSGRTAEVTYAFTVSFQYPDAQLAQAVVTDLANLYTRANESLRTETAAKTTAFLNTEAARLQRQLADTEFKLSQLKAKYGVQLGDNPALNLSRFEQTERELMQTDQDLRSARERRDLLQTDISRTPRYRAILDDSGQTMLAGSDRLAQAQQELVALRGRYSDDHPDVVRLRNEIAALSGAPVDQSAQTSQILAEIAVRQQELAAARQTYSDSHPDVVRLQSTIANLQKQLKEAGARRSAPAALPPATNPDYLQIVTRMRGADEEISTLNRRRSELSARLEEYRHGVFPSAQAEKEYTELSRELGFLQTQFSDIRSKQNQAALAQKLEAGQSGERLTVVDPPRLPTDPVKPNRVMLFFLGFVLALAGALGTAAVTEAMDKMVRGQKDVQTLMGDAPLAIIPYIQNSADARRRTRMNTMMAAYAAGAVVVVMLIIML
jgi:polysaccharide biosynthesis transport protein